MANAAFPVVLGKSRMSLDIMTSHRVHINEQNTLYFTTFYKITKIVPALCLFERRVCIRVCKHGCEGKMFGFLRANHASTNLKKVLS